MSIVLVSSNELVLMLSCHIKVSRSVMLHLYLHYFCKYHSTNLTYLGCVMYEIITFGCGKYVMNYLLIKEDPWSLDIYIRREVLNGTACGKGSRNGPF